jgi:hypothetical protein
MKRHMRAQDSGRAPSRRPLPPNSKNLSPRAVKECPDLGHGAWPVVGGSSQRIDCGGTSSDHDQC